MEEQEKMYQQNAVSDGRTLAVGHSRLSWGATLAGLFVSMLAYSGLVCLGLALGGSGMQEMIENEARIQSLGMGAALWAVVTVVISIYLGAHISGRIAGFVSTRVGRTQGLVIASLFFLIVFIEASMFVGFLGGGVGTALNSATGGASNIATSSAGREIIEDAIGDLNLKSPPTEVIQGVASRLLRGNQDSAVNYLAIQSGVDAEVARAKLETFQAQFTASAREAGIATARAAQTAGLTLFAGILLGALVGMLGGGVGANYNLRSPISNLDVKALRTTFAQ